MYKMRPVCLTLVTFYLCLTISFTAGQLLGSLAKSFTAAADKINPIKPINKLADTIIASNITKYDPIGTLTGNESVYKIDVLHPIDTLSEINSNTLNIQFLDPSILLEGKLNFNNYDPLALFKSAADYGKTWMYFPDGDGIPRVASLVVPPEDAEASSLLYFPTADYVVFHLYTRNNLQDSQILKTGDNDKLSQSNFDSTKKTKLVIHGWQSSASTNTCQEIKNNFLEMFDYNVICVDWSAIASNVIYPIPMLETRNVGVVVADLVDFLVAQGANVKDFHLLGHSLGAHTCGIAGKNIKSGKVSRITGMDPALPGFAIIAKLDYRLDPTDADFVDIIHTCSGVLGVFATIGHADYFPNGGVPRQPGCDGLPQIIEACSHGRAWEYYARSIKHRDEYIAVLCNSWESFGNGACITNPKTPMGDPVPSTTRGIFYLKTSTDI